jgi:hypothetical protein
LSSSNIKNTFMVPYVEGMSSVNHVSRATRRMQVATTVAVGAAGGRTQRTWAHLRHTGGYNGKPRQQTHNYNATTTRPLETLTKAQRPGGRCRHSAEPGQYSPSFAGQTRPGAFQPAVLARCTCWQG